mmetsp:Transcript_20803/g.43662  ORF Transcript_20803/g.43662 Transcript_20803/m.43662 type:complete len:92 (-) Transcript_20803:306-581(-)
MKHQLTIVEDDVFLLTTKKFHFFSFEEASLLDKDLPSTSTSALPSTSSHPADPPNLFPNPESTLPPISLSLPWPRFHPNTDACLVQKDPQS